MCIDLHTHSLYSDGSHSPRELVALGVQNHLQCLALTDHDTVEGVADVLRYGQELGLHVISGMEISATLRKHTVHILGYGINAASEALQTRLRPLQNGRAMRNRAILAKLHDLGIDISEQDLQTVSGHGQTGRPHFARLLVQRGVVDSFDAAFNQYLGRYKLAWAPRFSYTVAEAIDMIHQAGGIAVLAHPGMLNPDIRVIAALVQEMANHGLDGLEVYYPAHNRQLRLKLINLAKHHGLLVTGGSDFHGVTRPAHPLAHNKSGFCPPASLLPPLLAALAKKRLAYNSNRTCG